ncbi:hypothetical protein KY306_01370 [Candidatus Woesearchaeota archaeon]|nr:hypothetical protein [Candidatus Woesearchaeota archaeon]
MFNLFKKKKELKIPSPPSAGSLPSFPTPKDIEKLSPEELEAALKKRPVDALEEHKKRVVEKEKTELSETREHIVTKPIFIHAPTYKALIDEVSQMRNFMEEAENIVETLESFKEDQDRAFKSWQSTVKDIHEKLIYIDETLFKR